MTGRRQFLALTWAWLLASCGGNKGAQPSPVSSSTSTTTTTAPALPPSELIELLSLSPSMGAELRNNERVTAVLRVSSRRQQGRAPVNGLLRIDAAGNNVPGCVSATGATVAAGVTEVTVSCACCSTSAQIIRSLRVELSPPSGPCDPLRGDICTTLVTVFPLNYTYRP